MLKLLRPDDWHLHLRDGDRLVHTVFHTAQQFGRALIMPNLKPPVVTLAQAEAYRQRILAATPAGSNFQPMMVLYLTDNSDPREAAQVAASNTVLSYKLYPAGATTNSEHGVTAIEKVYPVLEQMEKHGVPLCVHGEETDSHVDIFDREKAFIDNTLVPTLKRFPGLKVVFEHITTKDAADFVRDSEHHIAATITAHHLLYNRNAIFQGGIRPHYYCLPVLKREVHRQALLAAATSGNPRFFLGTDSAPHAVGAKESSCGCAGCYTAHAAIELYAEAFESVNALDKLEGFASLFGADFYGVERPTETITLEKSDWTVPATYPFGNEQIVPLRALETLRFRMVGAA